MKFKYLKLHLHHWRQCIELSLAGNEEKLIRSIPRGIRFPIRLIKQKFQLIVLLLPLLLINSSLLRPLHDVWHFGIPIRPYKDIVNSKVFVKDFTDDCDERVAKETKKQISRAMDKQICLINSNYWNLSIQQRDNIWTSAIAALEEPFKEQLEGRKRTIQSFESMQYSSIYENYLNSKKQRK
jgi:hypothetical protein